MSFDQMRLKDVPAIQTIERKLKELSPLVEIDRAAYDPGNAYALILKADDRESRVTLSKELLDDIRDNPESPTSKYSLTLEDELSSALREAVESAGLLSYGEENLKFLLLRYLHEETSNSRPAHKYNVIGKAGRGMFEHWLRTTLRPDEKETLIWAWDELIRKRLIAPTGTDLVNPDDWIRVTEKGKAAIEGTKYSEYTGEQEFINRGEVFTAYKKIKAIMKRAGKDLLIIDSHVGEEVVDMLSTVDSSVEVRILTNYVHGDFKTAFQKLQTQRGRMHARKSDHFHDRFIVVDGSACFHLGSSIKDAGSKATVINLTEGNVASRVIKEAETVWANSAELFPKVTAAFAATGKAKTP
jgi:hypothetical protein